jgi:predicted outer membrane repeat protein
VTLADCTISGNSAGPEGAGGIDNVNQATLKIQNTIVAGNTAAAGSPDIAGTFTDLGNNLLGTALNTGNASTSDKFADVPGLAPLGSYGGPTQTMALLPNSPALGAGNPGAANLPAADQRGFSRLAKGQLDIGAYQSQPGNLTGSIAVTTAADPGQLAGQLSLREAVNLANAEETAPLDALTSATITLPAGLSPITLEASAIPLTGKITITGQGTISGNNLSKLFQINPGANVTLGPGLTLEAAEPNFGAISNGGTLTVLNCSFTGNVATVAGGAIYNTGILIVSGSTFLGNSAGQRGGAIDNADGVVTVTGCTFSGDSAGLTGGAIDNEAGMLTVANSTITWNSAPAGGGIWNQGTLTVIDSIIGGNSGAGIGGGAVLIDDSGDTTNATYTITDSTVQINKAPPITYSGAGSLTVTCGSGVDTFNIRGLSSTTPVTIDAGFGTTSVNVGAPRDTLEPLNGHLTINGAGLTSVTFDNQGADCFVNYTDAWSAHHVDFTNNAHIGSVLGVDFSDVAAMTVNDAGGGDTNNAHVFLVTPQLDQLTIHGTAGEAGGASSDYVQADAPAVGANDWRITGHYSGSLNGVVAFRGVDALLTNTQGADVFHFLPGGYMLDVGGAAGNNSTLDFSAYTPGITVTLSNGITFGSVAGAVQAFNAISSVIGTAGNDTFRAPSGGGLSGQLGGGGGSDTLDYSRYRGDIQVNLLLGTATGVAGGISAIENVIGSQGNELIVGDANANALIGGTGRNVIIGDGGSDTITGGGGFNLLIGGTTSYDSNLPALQALMQYWDNPAAASLNQLVNPLKSKNGVTINGKVLVFNKTTVQTDNAAGKLIGGSGPNWFIEDKDGDTINDGNDPGPNDRLMVI